MVRVFVFDAQGQLVGPVESPRVELSDNQWQQRLTPAQYRIARNKGTERPFCGTLLDNKQHGVYSCVCCGLPLFSSDSKFNSGTGWPSFFQPIASGNVAEHPDFEHGNVRVEILCARCDGHLGHVFPDGPDPTGLRFCLNSESLVFTPNDKLATLADHSAEGGSDKGHEHAKQAQSASAGAAVIGSVAAAVFAGGCFWCTEAAFEQLEGVSDVESGYAGGTKQTANYERVGRGDTGHAEVIRITYDPKTITFDRLLDVFFDAHDPTQLNRQGNDVGTQYRSAIFYSSPDQQRSAQEKIGQLTAAKAFPRPIVTTLEPLEAYYPAEAYHQDYARQNPDQPYVRHHSLPKACQIRERYPELIRKGK
ncbi:MAG: bifunctional methionine sulfoxide reductase B/A protein [Planctomycetaceae bacterium]|nr:bifunctional methionine sulfoxide reductase B/A protein [Planctomycetaceae bacterium]